MDWSKVLEIVEAICQCVFYSILVICVFKYTSKILGEIFEKIRISKTKKELLNKTEQNKKD